MKYISCAQIIGCLLVIMGHSYPLTGIVPQHMENLRQFIYYFHMPLFVFMSGYLLIYSGGLKKYGSKNYIKKRAVKLLTPYFLLSVVAFVPKVLLSSFTSDKAEFSFEYLITNFLVPRDNIWGHFWFIPMIFTCVIAGCLVIWAREKSKLMFWIALFLSFVIMILPVNEDLLGIEDFTNSFFYYITGMTVAYYPSVQKSILNNKLFLFCPVFVMLILHFYGYFNGSLTDELIVAAVALLMIAFVLRTCNIYDFSEKPGFKFLGKNIFSVFILSWPCQCAIEIIFNKILALDFYLVFILMLSGGIIIPAVIIKLINWLAEKADLKFLPLIIGG